MKFALDKQEKYTIFKLEEDNLNSILAPDLKSEFIYLRNEGTNNLILDLSAVKYVDSSGLSSILTGNRLWKDHGSFILTGIEKQPVVKKLIEISRLETILLIMPSMKEATDYVFTAEIERKFSSEEE